MEKVGYIEIRVAGPHGMLDLTPEIYDVQEIITLLQYAENLVFPNEKKDRPAISYKVESGAVRYILKTSLQAVIGFNAILGQISAIENIDFLESPTAKAIQDLQKAAVKTNYEFDISTSIDDTNHLHINSNTHFYLTELMWVDTEFYFYGKIINMGGKDKANFHLLTEEYGNLIIQVDKDYLAALENNPLYKDIGIRAVGRQNPETGEIDKASLKFLEFIDYHPKYDEVYLKKIGSNANRSWLKNINPDQWLREIRGNYDI